MQKPTIALRPDESTGSRLLNKLPVDRYQDATGQLVLTPFAPEDVPASTGRSSALRRWQLRC